MSDVHDLTVGIPANLWGPASISGVQIHHMLRPKSRGEEGAGVITSDLSPLEMINESEFSPCQSVG